MAEAKKDQNRVSTLIGVSSLDGTTPANVYVDPSTHRLYVDAEVTVGDAISTGSIYNTNHLDDYTTTNVTYIGQEDKDGVWKMIKIDETGNFPVFTYASISNNPTLTSYATAWAARATTAVYNVYSTAF